MCPPFRTLYPTPNLTRWSWRQPSCFWIAHRLLEDYQSLVLPNRCLSTLHAARRDVKCVAFGGEEDALLLSGGSDQILQARCLDGSSQLHETLTHPCSITRRHGFLTVSSTLSCTHSCTLMHTHTHTHTHTSRTIAFRISDSCRIRPHQFNC